MQKENTVKIGRENLMRVGRGLLGKLAGNRQLRFKIWYDESQGTLVLKPVTRPPGWPVIYFSQKSKSPCVRLEPVRKLYALPADSFPEGEYEAESAKGQIVVKIKNGRR